MIYMVFQDPKIQQSLWTLFDPESVTFTSSKAEINLYDT
jgi:hypothetical protein